MNRRVAGLFAALLAAGPRAAQACPICFGGVDDKSGLATGFWWAIVLLLAVTMSLIGGIFYAIWSIEKRRGELSALPAPNVPAA